MTIEVFQRISDDAPLREMEGVYETELGLFVHIGQTAENLPLRITVLDDQEVVFESRGRVDDGEEGAMKEGSTGQVIIDWYCPDDEQTLAFVQKRDKNNNPVGERIFFLLVPQSQYI